jgi:hypothetical protein
VDCIVGKGMWGGCSLQDPSTRLYGCYALPCAYMAIGLLAWGLGTSQRTHDTWALPLGWALHNTHVVLGLCLWVGHFPAQAFPSAHVAFRLCLWVGDKWCLGHGSGLKGNELVVRIHDQWV